jgi:hypothetical protein
MIKTIVVNDITYQYGQASAVDQLDLYETIGARLLANCVSARQPKVSINILKGLLMSAQKGTITHIADIVLPFCFKLNSESASNVSDFQGDIDSYVLLICHGLMVNLESFFISIGNQVTELIEELKAQEKNLL